ncbi:MAG: ABC transporter substrate-binding protein [Pseudolabrys sp.]|jgi:putative ABC transport system substrate-binding protein
MRRRDFIKVIAGSAVFWPLAARAQTTGRLYRVGFLWDSPGVFMEAIEAFRRGLRELGWIDGQNVAIEYRWAEGRPERMRELAEELVRLNVDIIVVPSSIYTEAAKRATSTIPIIFMSHAGPIESGHVDSLARPGGNITGLSVMLPETSVKGMQLLKEVVPGLSRVAVIWDPATPSHKPGLQAVESAAPAFRLQLQTLPVRASTEYDDAFAAMSKERAEAVLILTTPLYIAGASRLAELAIKHKLPMFGPIEFAKAGGLVGYGPNRIDLFRRGASYVDKVLKGASPADLPVEQPTKFELLINMKTAKLLGLTVSPTLLARADEVIE